MVIAAIAAMIVAHSHRPAPAYTGIRYNPFSLNPGPGEFGNTVSEYHAASGLSGTAYDAIRIGAWALIVFGMLLVVTGLIRYWAAQDHG
jgi:phosphoglucomutase